MGNVRILDCTLRDGGRIIDCRFHDEVIREIARSLADANIEIVEVGFLRGENLVEYKGNSTFFTNVSQIDPFIPLKHNVIFTAFIDFEMYDFSKLETCREDSVTGLRVGFTKKQFTDKRAELRRCLLKVKEQGYRLFMQGVNTLAYSDRELLEMIDFANEIEPYSFGIVDTYGAMYLDDIVHCYNMTDHNLNDSICIDIHSHNNFQLSFAFAQQIVSLADNRSIILDATLNGMGKCAGNLNTELIADYLTRKKNHDYDVDAILDIIDRYLYPLKTNNEWGYSIPAFMAGIYKAHPNNIIWLTEKYRLNSKDIKYIISGIDENIRQRYDYDNIQRIYKNYCENRVDDTDVIDRLSVELCGYRVLVIAPGRSVMTCRQKITEYIQSNEVKIICVNFVPKEIKPDYLFYANTIHWEKVSKTVEHAMCIVSSNVHTDIRGVNLVDYASLIEEDSILYDNSTIMLLNLLKKLKVNEIMLAGFDGLKKGEENYVDSTFPKQNATLGIDETNKEIKKLISQYKAKTIGKININFLTPSIYA